MTEEIRSEIYKKINAYADTVLKDIDPEMVPISIQLDKLRPEMEKLARQYNTTVSDVFVIYMDANSAEQKIREEEQRSKFDLDSEPDPKDFVELDMDLDFE